MLEQELQKLGLSDKEARIYLASLQLGKSPVQEIAQQAKVNRGTAYDIIRALMDKGLMSSFDQGKKTYFTAESPERLPSLIKMQEEDLKLKAKEFSKYLPELQSMYDSSDNKPKVKYYEGAEGLVSIQEEYLKVKKKEIWSITNVDGLAKFNPKYDNRYIPRRIDKGILGKVIYISKDGPKEHLKTDEKELRESKYISFSEFPFEADITIFDNKISLEAYKNKPIGVLIENESLADSMRALFKYLWNKKD